MVKAGVMVRCQQDVVDAFSETKSATPYYDSFYNSPETTCAKLFSRLFSLGNVLPLGLKFFFADFAFRVTFF